MKIVRVVLAGIVFLAGAVLDLSAQTPSKTPTSAPGKPDDAKAAVEKKSEEETPTAPGAQRGFKFRNIGPAAGGGRITAIAGIPGVPNVIYLGSCSGGVFKTVDGGVSWKAVFEKEPPSICAIQIAPSNPNLAWVGTGEANPRNNAIDPHGPYFLPVGRASRPVTALADARR